MKDSSAKRAAVHAGWLVSALAATTLGACQASTGTMTGPVGETPTAGASQMGSSGSMAQSGTAATSVAAAGSGATQAGAAAQAKAGAAAPSAGAAGSAASAVAGTGQGGSGNLTAGNGAAGNSGMVTAAGSGGAVGSAFTFKECMSDDVGPCGLFTTQEGTKLQLLPYGAVMERNVGKGYEAPLAPGDSDDGSSCARVVASFGEDPEKSKPLLNTDGIDFGLYTIYRPAQWPEGVKLPIITWGNGTCAKTEGYGALLRYVASRGFFIVASNSRWVGSNGAMTKALDFAFAAAADANSPYYNLLDTTKVGAMGHSQGGMATITAARDARVKTVIIFNGGSSAVKPFLAVSGDKDIGNPTVSGMKNSLTGNPPGAYLFYHKTVGTGSVPGHLTLMTQPERVIQPTAAWFKHQLHANVESAKFFVGDDCKLCNMATEFEYGQKGLP